MNRSLKYREFIPETRRVIVKVGSHVIVQRTGRPDVRRLRALVAEIAALHKDGKEVVLVSSGAVAAGVEALGLGKRPETVPEMQMAAAVGQTRLMSRYSELFGKHGIKVGQVLLTHRDFHHKVCLSNSRRTLNHLMTNRVVPIVNENDVTADEEIRADLSLGDNDHLAALVAKLIRADLLILLSTVDGIREPAAAGRTRRVAYAEKVGRRLFELVQPKGESLSKGGMSSKLKAARTAAQAGCSVVIANGRGTGTLTSVMNGEDNGTLLLGIP